MKTQFLVAVTLAISLNACGAPVENGAADKPAEAATSAKDTPTPSVPGAFTKGFMIGKWADAKDNDCTLAQDFKADGTVDGAFDSWSVVGSELHAMMAGENRIFTVKIIDEKHIDVQSPEGKKSRLVRC